jgi:hypothetical protein
MYHPLDEATDVDLHEFIELYNDESTPVDLSYWRLVGQVRV